MLALIEKSSFMCKGTGKPNSLSMAASGCMPPVSNPPKFAAKEEPFEFAENTLSSLKPVSNLSCWPSSNKFFVCSLFVIYLIVAVDVWYHWKHCARTDLKSLKSTSIFLSFPQYSFWNKSIMVTR